MYRTVKARPIWVELGCSDGTVRPWKTLKSQNVCIYKTFAVLQRLLSKMLLQHKETNTFVAWMTSVGRKTKKKGVLLLTCYVHCNTIPTQTPLLFNLLSFRNGLALCSGQAGSHSCSASVRVDGAAVRKSALWSDWKSMLGISCLCSSVWRSCSVYLGFLALRPAAVLSRGIGGVGVSFTVLTRSLAHAKKYCHTTNTHSLAHILSAVYADNLRFLWILPLDVLN